MEVEEGIHLIECPFGNPPFFTGVYAILGETVTLVDTGIPKSPEEAIFPYLRRVGRDPGEISLVIVGHAHFDHCGGVPAIREKAPGAKVMAPEAGRPYIEDDRLIIRQLHARFPSLYAESAATGFKPSNVDLVFGDGDEIDLGDRRLEVLGIPGHSPDSCCIVDRSLNASFSSDGVEGYNEGDGSRGGYPLIFHDAAMYLESMKRLSLEPIETLLMAHPFPPFNQAVLRGEHARAFVEESIRGIEVLYAIVREQLQASGRPVHLSEIHRRVPGSAAVTVGCILESLASEGTAERIREGEDFAWKAA